MTTNDPIKADAREGMGAQLADGLSSTTEPSSTVSALTGFDPSRKPRWWLSVHSALPNDTGLLDLGESIPDQPFYIVGTLINGSEAEELGYREFAKYGGWLIWHQEGNDFYVIDCAEPRRWLPIDAIATEARRAETTGSVEDEGASGTDRPNDTTEAP